MLILLVSISGAEIPPDKNKNIKYSFNIFLVLLRIWCIDYWTQNLDDWCCCASKRDKKTFLENAFMHDYTKVHKFIFHMKSVVAIIREVLYSILLRRAAEMLGYSLMLCLSWFSRYSSSWFRSIKSKLRDSLRDDA